MKVGTVGWTDVPLLTDTKPPARHTPSAQSQQNPTEPHFHRGRGPDSTSRMASDNNCDFADQSLCREHGDPLCLHFQDRLRWVCVCRQRARSIIHQILLHSISPHVLYIRWTATCHTHPPALAASPELERPPAVDWTKITQRRR